jgi:hypothetical protein
MIEKGIPDSFDEGCFTSAIWPVDGSRAAPEIYRDIPITLNVL